MFGFQFTKDVPYKVITEGWHYAHWKGLWEGCNNVFICNRKGTLACLQGNETRGGQEVTVAASLPHTWEELITEQQWFQSSAHSLHRTTLPEQLPKWS